MSALSYLVLAIAKILGMLINLYTFVVAISVLLSWVNPDPYNPIVRFLYQATMPVFRLVRRFMPRALFRMSFDITPLVVLILLIVIDTVFVGMLFEFAEGLR